jgi:ubiquinone/menaquinone biosynthesis C-methylase UbiE
MNNQQHFFDFAAEAGLTKHLGGLEATEELITLCHIDKNSYVLDVGCGVGQTACYIAKKYSSRVVGVDISQKMIERSKERAEREGVADRAEFRVVDAQDLLFEDDLFDAVITESVTAFPENKQQAIREYARVIKPGGHIGLNESTWLKTPPPPKILEWVSQDLGAHVKPLTSDDWIALLEGAGLTVETVKIRQIRVQDEAKGIIRRYGYRGMIRSAYRALIMYLKNPSYRKFVKEVKNRGIVPDNLEKFFGYGVYIARK